MKLKDIVSIDPEVVSGVPVFKGTRVPIQILFDHLEGDIPIKEFLEDYPSVTREQVYKLLEFTGKTISSSEFVTMQSENTV